MQKIKWSNESSWQQVVVLGDIPFILSGYWNTRDEAWYIDITTNDFELLVIGKKLILNTDLLNNINNEAKPKGTLLVVPINDTIMNITRDNMGIDIDLIFIGDNELL